MKVVVFVKATPSSEAGTMPSVELMNAMQAYNEELMAAGLLKAGEGLKPSSAGARVQISGDRRTVVDGPFAETQELVAGFWIWEVDSMASAIEWAKKCPSPMPEDSELEIRPMYGPEDFADIAPEVVEKENEMRKALDS
ncbi:YCII-related domain protein [Posidoniimonas polymericola]|uniref:YCII-related domain protein n=1 Tax=Posidoniimonas polymericola TaxID=2528002 RepID=A0A5C5YFE7_9BACT|nr:YciI family protein [Posidoniimonas polymericola]TWT74446.1 YCII-related domain protein [Posidoniimonas polymericola]